MIKKLRISLIITIMSSLSTLLVGVLVLLNIINYSTSRQDSLSILRKISKSEGYKYTGEERKNKNDTINYNYILRASQLYTVIADFEGNVIKVINDSSDGYTDQEIQSFAQDILRRHVKKGRIDHLLYHVRYMNNKVIIVFLDNSIADIHLRNTIILSFIFGILGLVALFLISVGLARKITKPIEDTFKKQKNFISDASHELKTPLSIIKANADTLETEIGGNKWLRYIQKEAERMNDLVNSLLTLAQSENQTDKNSFEEMDLSEVISGQCMVFDVMAYENQLTMQNDIEPGLTFQGDIGQIEKLCEILIDNAIQHSEKCGIIVVSLRAESGHLYLEVKNTGEPIPVKDRDKIFERFYRSDKARNRNKGNYGLGLSIAKSIVEVHGGTIHVECADHWTKFIIIF